MRKTPVTWSLTHPHPMATLPHDQATSFEVTLLGTRDRHHLFEFLGHDIPAHVFMLSWLSHYGLNTPGRPELFHFRGAFDDRQLAAVALSITDRLLWVSSTDRRAAEALGIHYRSSGVIFEHIVSRAPDVDAFWQGYSRADFPTSFNEIRLCRTQQYYELLPEHFQEQWASASQVRIATPDDLEAILAASAQMHAEETLEDPLVKNPSEFTRHVQHRLNSQRTFAWFEGKTLIFKADISADSPWGAQISGVYTAPGFRGMGYATRGMAGIIKFLFERQIARVTLYVNEDNEPARRVYLRLGFRYHTDFRTLFLQDRSSK